MKRIFSLIIAVGMLLAVFPRSGFAQTAEGNKPKLAGEFFGVPVSLNNYYFAKRAVLTFNASWRGVPQNAKQLEDLTWQELLFSYEAYRRKIKPTEQEIDQQIAKILKAQKVKFRFRVDKDKYAAWTEKKLHMDVVLFHNMIAHLVQLQKLKDQVINSFDPKVTDKEAYDKFLDEYNTMLVELKQFDDKKKAQAFYEKAIVPVMPQAEDELIWHDLLYSYEASLRNIKPDKKTIKEKIRYLLFDYRALFNPDKDPDSYAKWIKSIFGMSRKQFEDMMEKIGSMDALIEKVAAGKEKPVLDKPEYKKFRKQYKTLSEAYAAFVKEYANKQDFLHFTSLAEARKFYTKIHRQAGFWEDQKRMYPKEFKRPGFVALDFLIHMWGFKRKDAYAMMNEPIGCYYPPAPIYKGYGVFKIMRIRKADPKEYASRKNFYLNKMKMITKYDLYREWVKDLKKRANIKRFVNN